MKNAGTNMREVFKGFYNCDTAEMVSHHGHTDKSVILHPVLMGMQFVTRKWFSFFTKNVPAKAINGQVLCHFFILFLVNSLEFTRLLPSEHVVQTGEGDRGTNASAFRSAFSRERLVVVMDSFGIMAKIDKGGFNMYSIHVDTIR